MRDKAAHKYCDSLLMRIKLLEQKLNDSIPYGADHRPPTPFSIEGKMQALLEHLGLEFKSYPETTKLEKVKK